MLELLKKIQTYSGVTVCWAHSSAFFVGPIFAVWALVSPSSARGDVARLLLMVWAWAAAVGILGGLAVCIFIELIDGAVGWRRRSGAIDSKSE